jgi:hypothetical protein
VFDERCMSKVKKLLKQLENLIEERDDASKTEISRLIKNMSQEEKEAVGFRIILDIIHWMETLDWEDIDKKTVMWRTKNETSSTERKNPGEGYLGAFGLILYTRRQWGTFGKFSGNLVLATENKTVPKLPQANINEWACGLFQEILKNNFSEIFSWSNALMEGFVTERGGLFIDAAVKDTIWFILDHIKDFKDLKLERHE